MAEPVAGSRDGAVGVCGEHLAAVELEPPDPLRPSQVLRDAGVKRRDTSDSSNSSDSLPPEVGEAGYERLEDGGAPGGSGDGGGSSGGGGESGGGGGGGAAAATARRAGGRSYIRHGFRRQRWRCREQRCADADPTPTSDAAAASATWREAILLGAEVPSTSSSSS